MRVNVYAEELTSDFCVVTTEAEGKVFYGVRLFLESSPKLHFKPTDDDRSAVTIWARPGPDGLHKLADILSNMGLALDKKANSL